MGSIKIDKAEGITIDDNRPAAAKAAAATWDGETIAARLLKADPARRYTLDVAYPADKADVALALDGHRDFASKAAVEDAAWDYMRRFRQVGVYHADGTEGAAEVVESYVYRGPDWAVQAADGSECVIKAGDWLVGFIWSPEAWADIEAGKIGGVSVQGKARRRKPSAEAVAGLRR
jgi:putative serine protease XkdF